jgi:SAM-dependent methyltransferase
LRESRSFEDLIAEADHASFSGWNFAWLKGRYIEGDVSWNYREKVLARMKASKRFLDMGTGGGELLSSLQPFPDASYATEGYPPNVPIARNRLEPLGVKVLQVEGTNLPFEDGFLDLIINRHEEYASSELYRVLTEGGFCLTQQVGAKNLIELHNLLGLESVGKTTFSIRPEWDLSYAVAEFKEAGFRILEGMEEFLKGRFNDVGALVYLLKAVPWDVPDFTFDNYREKLLAIHQKILSEGFLEVTTHRFFIEAQKD